MSTTLAYGYGFLGGVLFTLAVFQGIALYVKHQRFAIARHQGPPVRVK